MYYPQNWYQPLPNSREITVIGIGMVDAQPNYAQIQIEVRTEGENVSQAQQENAVIMNRVIESLLSLNIPRESIQTTAFSIFPRYDYIEGRQVFSNYEVQNAINVKISEINQVGTVIDTAIQNGANRVSSIQFKLDDTDTYYQAALNLALVDAISKAKSMTETIHVSLQPIPVEIVEEKHNDSPVLYKTFQVSSQESMTPIEKGTFTITASVRVRFQF